MHHSRSSHLVRHGITNDKNPGGNASPLRYENRNPRSKYLVRAKKGRERDTNDIERRKKSRERDINGLEYRKKGRERNKNDWGHRKKD